MKPATPLPRAVWVLGFVSLAMDVSSEMIHALLPAYLVVGLGASALVVGVIEGVAEATALAVRVFSGTLSDALRHRKWVAAAGYGLGALAKPLFALATGPGLVFAARFIDRIGKGIRGAPRDALIADVTPPERRGEAFGLRQSLDTVGAFAGPLLAMALMLAWSGDFRAVFWVAVIPGALSFLLIAFAVREPPPAAHAGQKAVPFSWRAARGLGSAFWWVTAAGAALMLARFSEAFLILKAVDLGVAASYTPLVLVAMNVVFSLVAYPAGRLADRIGTQALLIAGTAMLALGDLVLAFASGLPALAAGVALWGLHLGLTQGLLAARVAATCPPERRGTAFGVFHLASGVALLASSVLAGALWHTLGPTATFLAGAAFAAAAMGVMRFSGR
jgi:MFS family permease